MAKWGEYKPDVDAELDRLKREDPQTYAQIMNYAYHPPGMSTDDQNKLYGPAWNRLVAGGMDKDRAANLLLMTRNVYKFGDKPVDDLIPADGVISPGQFMGGLPERGFLLKGAQAAGDAAAKDVIRADLDKFIAEMMGPVSPNDPVYTALLQGGTDAAQASAAQAGLSGRSGLAGTQAASVAQQNVTPYLAQRQSLGLQAQGLRANHELGLEGLAQGWDKINSAKADAQWAAEQNARQTAMGLVGTTLGTIGSMYGLPVTPTMGGQFGASLASLGDTGPKYTSGSNYATRNTAPRNPGKPGRGEGF